MTATHHPSDAVLMAYGAGALGEGLALVVATHVALCPRCAAEVARLEAVGGGLLEDIEPAALDDAALDALLARLDGPDGEPAARAAPPLPPPVLPGLGIALPEPLRRSLAGADMAWRFVSPGVRQIVLQPPARPGAPSTRLLRVAAGQKVPAHGHRGLELTLVLEGGYTDTLGHFGAGDLSELEADADHQPMADAGVDCICLVALDAPVTFTGPLLGSLQRLLRL